MRHESAEVKWVSKTVHQLPAKASLEEVEELEGIQQAPKKRTPHRTVVVNIQLRLGRDQADGSILPRAVTVIMYPSFLPRLQDNPHRSNHHSIENSVEGQPALSINSIAFSLRNETTRHVIILARPPLQPQSKPIQALIA